MRQRVALGRLLAYEPDIYLMDEPFGALDSQTKAAMGHELLRIWHANRRSVLFVTHDIEEAVTLSDRVIVLSSRPSRIALDRAIDLERPRDRAHLRKNPRFSELVDEIWNALEH
jgi:NitT/TauT family transport system ATP-binding protein